MCFKSNEMPMVEFCQQIIRKISDIKQIILDHMKGIIG